MTGFTLRFGGGFIRFGTTGGGPRFRCRQLAAVTAGNALFRLFMSRFTRLLLTFQSGLACFKARFGFEGTFRFQIDGAQLSFFLPVILHQRNIARADIGAGPAFNAIINVMRTRLIVVAALAVPVKLLWQQFSRAGIRTGRTANAGLFFVVVAHFAAGRSQNAVGDLHHRHVQRRQGKAHQGAAHDHHLARARTEPNLMQQMADRRAETAPDVARLGDRLAGQRHDAFCNRFTVDNRALNCPGGPDVLHQHADIGRAPAVRNLHPGQDAGQLFSTARGVFGRDHPDLQIALAA